LRRGVCGPLVTDFHPSANFLVAGVATPEMEVYRRRKDLWCGCYTVFFGVPERELKWADLLGKPNNILPWVSNRDISPVSSLIGILPMATSPEYSQNGFLKWLFAEEQNKDEHHQVHPWRQVMCLTGVDYFSTLGYQPGIAALAAGALSPIATMILVLLTLFGALPIYRRVAAQSPNGEGSISMLERLLNWWNGKIIVLVLLGFVATDFIITITLSAADAAIHITENPLAPHALHGQEVLITLTLVFFLAAVFLKGFKEAVGIAVVLVGSYLFLNYIVMVRGISEVMQHPEVIGNWQEALFQSHGNPLTMVAAAALLFPKLALGLSGFETGVAIMPMVQGRKSDTPENPAGRIRNTDRLLTSAAYVMSGFLIVSSFVTTLLIEPSKFKHGGEASGRALSYLAHTYLGSIFGTAYDFSTICILWFAGASAMAGLLNIVPRYLPRYGMAPDWARATRPLVLMFTLIATIVTIAFKANVEAQGGAYATGVLVLMSSAALAVTLANLSRQGWNGKTISFVLITLVFVYTTAVNIFERPDGIRIAGFFIGAIVFTSMISRVSRSTELRTDKVEVDEVAMRLISELHHGKTRIIANALDAGDEEEYYLKEKEVRDDNHIPMSDPVIFLEVEISDASNFQDTVKIEGIEVGPYKILRTYSPAVPNAIASILLYLRDETGHLPHVYFSWGDGNPFKFLVRFIVFGEGDIPAITREVLRKAEANPIKRPRIHVGG
jgi:hypothetical protein